MNVEDILKTVLAFAGVALVVVLIILGWRIVAVSIGFVKIELEAPDPELPVDEPTIKLADTPTSLDAALCTRLDFDGSKCTSTNTVFPSDTEAVYVTWQSSDALARRTRFTRRWYRDGRLLLERSNSAGENARWTPSDGRSYYAYLSATEGTGKRLFGSDSLPTGSYRIELYADGSLASSTEFVLQ